jgi:hypothetical protein
MAKNEYLQVYEWRKVNFGWVGSEAEKRRKLVIYGLAVILQLGSGSLANGIPELLVNAPNLFGVSRSAHTCALHQAINNVRSLACPNELNPGVVQ